VSSVFTRTGAVVATAGDYSAAQVGAAPGVAPWLAHVSYGPAVQGSYLFTNAMAAMDDVNLTIPFTAPASGKVFLVATLFIHLTPTEVVGDENYIILAFMTHPGGAVISPYQRVVDIDTQVSSVASTWAGMVTYGAPITGLGAGNNYQYDLGGLYGGSGVPVSAASYYDNGAATGDLGPVTLFVYAA
jgi:hypothetical protein